MQKVFSTQLNININLSVFFFKTQLGISEPVKDWQALTTSMLFVLNNVINKRLKVKSNERKSALLDYLLSRQLSAAVLFSALPNSEARIYKAGSPRHHAAARAWGPYHTQYTPIPSAFRAAEKSRT